MRYDFQNDLQNDAARKNYDAAMNGKIRKGVDFFEKPLTWDEERPSDPFVDTPAMNIVPIPIPSTDGFKEYSLLKKVLIIAGVIAVVALFAAIGVSFFRDGGFRHMGFGNHFW